MFIIKGAKFSRNGDKFFFEASAESFIIENDRVRYWDGAAWHQIGIGEGDRIYILNAETGDTLDKYIVDTRK